MPLRGKDIISIQDIARNDILRIFKKTHQFRKHPRGRQLKNMTIVMLFAKPSTRTRVSFEVAVNQLGGDDIFLPTNEMQLSRGESIGDTARVLSRYCQCIIARLFRHKSLLTLAAASTVPVINGLTDLLHPCQGLTDLFTVFEKKGTLDNLKLVFLGDGSSNVCHSLMHACSKLGVDMVISHPKGYQPQNDIVQNFRDNAMSSGAVLSLEADPKKAAANADILYTDTWVSMGEERETRERIKALGPYQLNRTLMNRANSDCIVMHDLPAHRGQEITSGVMDSAQSVIFEQAENRLHVEKALLALILGR